MNKNTRIALLMATAVGMAHADCGNETNIKGHTFFTVRPQFQSAMPEKESFFRNNRMEMREDGWGSAFQAVVFGGKSVKSRDLAAYFLPSCASSSCLNVMEFDEFLSPLISQDNNPDKDVEARNFNIDSIDGTFASKVCFCPKQSVIGVGLDWKQAFCRRENGCVTYWGEISFPIVRVENTMGLTEDVTNEGGGPDTTAVGLDGAPRVANMTDAFRQSTWKYGKINSNCKMTKTRIADIELKVGWDSCSMDCCHLEGYLGLVIPTGNRPKGEFVFEPIVGNNRHFGFMYGSNLGFDLWNCDDHKIVLEVDWNGRWLFRNHQTRSFDLCDKSWGRYQAVYATVEDAQAAFDTGNPDSGTSGINIFTHCVKVSPRFANTFNTAFVYTHCSFMAELGWNFYARQAEKVELDCWASTAQVKDISGAGLTNTAATIRNNYPASGIPVTEFQALALSDLDLNSAAHPAVLSHIIYGAVGYNWDDRCYPTFLGLGASYEFSHVNTALTRWTLWGKAGISF